MIPLDYLLGIQMKYGVVRGLDMIIEYKEWI